MENRDQPLAARCGVVERVTPYGVQTEKLGTGRFPGPEQFYDRGVPSSALELLR